MQHTFELILNNPMFYKKFDQFCLIRFPSITSIKSSALASYLSTTSAFAIRYSANIVFTVSKSNSDCCTKH
ncbi:hypothetical protein DERP_001823 [Dermatophagoides pteronyssinus]|uniref:Uncharacterized protein n=1 Tax=Dermatophagoides pteronyssinus TaxID=6956 RepID=A0ABQ8JBK3_DERPT|nr:hypothetical protein DERP_001823 [Dermatophagoides pteronyssinus]